MAASALPPGVALRVMAPADIRAAEHLREQAGWNQTPADWERLLAWAPGGCFVAESAERVVGTVTTTAYGSRLAWIGMLLVDAAHRRRGVGRALLTRALDHLERSVAVQTVALDATPLGQPLYTGMGFVVEWALQRWEGRAPRLARPPGVRPVRAADLEPLAALSLPAFGVARTGLLRDLFAAHPPGCFLLERTGAHGYVFSRPGARGWYVGPLVATDAAAAQLLLRAALQRLEGELVIMDAPDLHGAALLGTLGFAPCRSLTRMRRGAALPPGSVHRYFGIAGLEIG